MRDTVFIEDLSVETIVGLYPWERAVPQELRLDIELAADTRKAAQTGELSHGIDYAQVAVRVTQIIQEGEFELLETMLEQCAEKVMQEFKCPWLRLRVRKSQVMLEAASVGIEIVRGER